MLHAQEFSRNGTSNGRRHAPGTVETFTRAVRRNWLLPVVIPVVVLLDREQRPECCSDIASGVADNLAACCAQRPSVVVKNRSNVVVP